MSPDITQELIKYGGATGVIVAVAYLLNKILPMLGLGNNKQLDSLLTNHMVHLQGSLDSLVGHAKKEEETGEKMLMTLTEISTILRER